MFDKNEMCIESMKNAEKLYTLIIGDNLDPAVLVNTDTRVSGTKIDTDHCTHFLVSFFRLG